MVHIEDDAIVPFVEARDGARCPECDATVTWQVNLDADGTTYKASHCGNDYYMVPHHYRFIVDEGGVPADEQEDEQGEAPE